MSYDLVAVGGTGKWFAARLLWLHRQEYLAVRLPLPKSIVVVDGHGIAHDDVSASAALHALRQEVDAVRTHGDPTIRATVDVHEWRPRLAGMSPPSLAGQLGDDRLLQVALTQRERERDVRAGFYASPRLGAAAAAQFGFDRVDGGAGQFPLRDPEFFAAERGPLVIIGSVAGGTGAGLMPMFLKEVRSGAPEAWKRSVRLIAVLPWFAPPDDSQDAESSVNFDGSCRNAAECVRALSHVVEALYEKARSEARKTNVTTEVLVVGRDKAAAKADSPPASDATPGSAANNSNWPEIGRAPFALVDSVLLGLGENLPSPGLTGEADQKYPQMAAIGLGLKEDWQGEQRLELLCAVHDAMNARQRSTARAAARAQVAGIVLATLADLPFDQAASCYWSPFGSLQPSGGLGQALGLVVAALARCKSSERRGQFIRALQSRLHEAAKATAPMQLGDISRYEDPDVVLRELDQVYADVSEGNRPARRHLANAVYHADMGMARNAEDAAHDVSKSLVLVVLAAWEPLARAVGKEAAAGNRMATAAKFVTLLPVSLGISAPAVKDATALSAQIVPLSAENTERLARAYDDPPPSVCRSGAYASGLSVAHVLSRLARRFPSSDQDRAWLVVRAWRQLAQGKVVIAAPAVLPAWVNATEPQLERDFGAQGPKLAMGGAKVMGMTSTALGIVPTAQEIDGPERIVPHDFGDHYDLVLRAFAQHHFPQSNDAPAWAKLLHSLEVSSGLANSLSPREVLKKHSVPAVLLMLRGPHGNVVELAVPRVMTPSAAAAARKVASSARAKRHQVLHVTEANEFVSVRFRPFLRNDGFEDVDLGEVLKVSKDWNRVLDIDLTNIELAANALPPSTADMQEALSWA